MDRTLIDSTHIRPLAAPNDDDHRAGSKKGTEIVLSDHLPLTFDEEDGEAVVPRGSQGREEEAEKGQDLEAVMEAADEALSQFEEMKKKMQRKK